MGDIVQWGLIGAALLSVAVGGLFLGGALIEPEVMLRGYPPDIKAKYGPPGPRGKRLQRVVSLLLLPVLFGVPGWILWNLRATTGADLAFLPAFGTTWIALMGFNAFDLVVLDWLVFVTLQPRFVVLKGTEGLAGYRDYGFHFRAFLRGTVIITAMAAFLAGIGALVA